IVVPGTYSNSLYFPGSISIPSTPRPATQWTISSHFVCRCLECSSRGANTALNTQMSSDPFASREISSLHSNVVTPSFTRTNSCLITPSPIPTLYLLMAMAKILLLVHPISDRHDLTDIRLVGENERDQDLLGKVFPSVQIHRGGHNSALTLPLRILKDRRNDVACLYPIEDFRKPVHATEQPNLSEKPRRLYRT